MSGTFWGGVLVFINTIPGFLIFYIAFRHKMKVRAIRVFVYNALLCALFMAAYFILAPDRLSFSFLQTYKLAIVVPSIGIVFAVTEGSNYRIFYFNTIIMTYVIIATKTGNFLAYYFYAAPSYFQLAVMNFVVFAPTFPLMLYFITRLLTRTIDDAPAMNEDIWKIIWVIPMLFLSFCLLFNYNFNPSTLMEPQFLLINVLTVAGLFISSNVLLKIMQLASESVALKHIDQMKTEFLRNMSHEMKTPLTVISTDILNAGHQLDFDMDKEDMRNSLQNAQQEIMRMSRMVDSALKYSSMQLNQITESLDLAELLRVGTEAYRSVAGRHGNILTLGVPEKLPLVYGNMDMLLQAFSNLLSNANRHTRGGEIAVNAQLGDGAVMVTVSDSGEGVEPEILSQAFSRGISTTGGGLGLFICKSVIENMGGQITLESEQGKGTTVTFTLPAHTDEKVNDYE